MKKVSLQFGFFAKEVGFWRFILAAAAVSFSASCVSGVIIYELTGLTVDREVKHQWLEAVGAITFGPVIESVLVAFLVMVSSKVTTRNWIVVLLGGGGAALLHSLVAANWAIYVFVPFLCFVYTYVLWKAQHGFKVGFWACTIVHGGHNFLVYLSLVLMNWLGGTP